LQLSVIIVNFNVKYFLEQCLYSVEKAIQNIKAEIIVIDNNSTDGSKEFFSNKFANVQFIWNEKNDGFSEANNKALQFARGEYILFLNPDTIIPEDCFEKCLSFFETKKNIGAMGLRMIDGTGNFLKESKRGFPSLFPSLFKLCGLAAIFPDSKIFARYYLGNLSEDENHAVDVLAGAFMMVKKNVLNETGSFDNDFFMYGEDIDLSYRIEKAGYKNYYFSESTIIHFKGESTKKESIQHVRLFYGAMNLFVRKHYESFQALLYSIFIYTATGFKLMLIFCKKLLYSSGKNRKRITVNTLPTLIVANEKDYESVMRVIKNAGTKLQIMGRVHPEDYSSNNTAGKLEELPQLINRYAVETIIFCINGLSAKEIISIIQSIHPPVSYQFHAVGSCSIVGSSNKNSVRAYIVEDIKGN
jgi:GT2 family glycosyltransferase